MKMIRFTRVTSVEPAPAGTMRAYTNLDGEFCLIDEEGTIFVLGANTNVTSVNGIEGPIVVIDAEDIGLGNVPNVDARARASHTGVQAISTVTGLQAAIDGKSATGHTHAQADVTNLTSDLALKADLTGGKVPSSQLPSIALVEFKGAAASQVAMLLLSGQPGDFCFRTDEGLAYFIVTGTGSTLSDWQAVSTPASVGVVSVNGNVGVVVLGKSDVGLGNVDNTADTAKPVSTAQQTALDAKATTSALTTHTGNTSNPHSVTKSQVGLANVDNTSDVNKPVSTVQQTALNLKATTATTVAGAKSISGGGSLAANRTLELVNDESTPGANKVYGTDGSGVRGWKADPAGVGGSGGVPVGGAGVLQGYTTAEVPASTPGDLMFILGSEDTEWVATLIVSGTPYIYTASATDPADGSTWIDTTSGSWTGSVCATALAAAITANTGSHGCSAYAGSNTCQVASPETGSGATLAGDIAGSSGGYVSGGGAGADGEPASGAVTEVQLVAQDGTKTLRALLCGSYNGDLAESLVIVLRSGGTDYPICSEFSGTGDGVPLVGAQYAEYVTGRASAAIFAKLVGSTPTGGSVTCWASATKT